MKRRRRPEPPPEREGPLIGEVHPVSVTALDRDGAGTAHIDGLELTVGGVTPGDEVSVRIVARSEHADRGWAEVVEVHSRGPTYETPPCRRGEFGGGQCGGCAMQHVAADAQLQWKRSTVAQHLKGVWQGDVEIFASPEQWRYRNRSNFAVFRDGGGNVRLGSFQPRSREGARMDHCQIVRRELEQARHAIEEVMRNGMYPVHYRGEQGIRWVSARSGSDGTVLVEVITSGDRDSVTGLALEVGALDGVAGVFISHNTLPGNAVRDELPIHIVGRPTVEEKVGPLTIPLGPATFFQLNTAVAGQMYQRAAEYIGDARRVVDLYCGVGGIGLTWALGAPGRRVEGAEYSGESVAVARQVSANAGISSVFNELDLGRAVPNTTAGADVVVVNPPRRGLDRTVVAALVGTHASRVVYMSCSPESFARDVAVLKRSGWALRAIEAHDMLPQTAHVELIALLER